MINTQSRGKVAPERKASDTQPSAYKSFPVAITGIDEEQGIVEAIVNTTGVIDSMDDVIHPGAFTKTLAENWRRVRVLDGHNNRSILSIIGMPLSMREVGRDELPQSILSEFPDARGGLYTKTQYLLGTPEGRGAFERIRSGAVGEYSIGFDALDTDMEKVLDANGGKTKTVRNIRQLRLWEYSPVVWGASVTGTVSVKAAEPTTPSDDIENVSKTLASVINEAAEHKVGRVLSARNFQALQQAAELLNAVLGSASLNDGDEPGNTPDKSQHDDDEHKGTHTPDGPQDAPDTPTSPDEAGPLREPHAPAVSTVELQTKIAQFLTDMEG